MAQQLRLDLGQSGEKTAGEYMLWHESSKASLEQAIRNATKYYEQKYGLKSTRVVLPLTWRKDDDVIKVKPLEEALGLEVDSNPLIQTRHIAVYGKQKE